MHHYCSFAVTSGIHIYCQPRFELDRNPVIVDCDLLDVTADNALDVLLQNRNDIVPIGVGPVHG